MARKKKNHSNRNILYFVGLGFLLLVTLLISLPSIPAKITSFGASVAPNINTQHDAKKSLQLYWFLLPTPTVPPSIALTPHIIPLVPPSTPAGKPPPSNSCGIASPMLKTGTNNGKCCVQDGPVHSPSDCCPSVPYCDLTTRPPKGSPGITCSCGGGSTVTHGGQAFSGTCNGTAKYWCNAKPVIYLYPEHKTTVDVAVNVPGEVTVSDPLYPPDGWKGVTAYPDGALRYQGKSYHELFYEASVTPLSPPTSGFIVPVRQLESTLEHLTATLGLREGEQKEFLAYWMPRLTELHTPYVFVSVFSQEQKELIDHVTINPKPDTFVQMIFYFKGLEQPEEAHPLELSAIPPQRKGFTAVEWGGILDRNEK